MRQHQSQTQAGEHHMLAETAFAGLAKPLRHNGDEGAHEHYGPGNRQRLQQWTAGPCPISGGSAEDNGGYQARNPGQAGDAEEQAVG